MHRAAGRRHSPRARHAAPTRPLRRVLTALGVVFALLAVTGTAAAVVAYYRLNGNINHKDLNQILGANRPDKVAEEKDHAAKNILLMGSDRRAGDEAFGERSDTTILLHLAADRKSATLVSIPRDTMVDVPECQTEDGGTVPAQSTVMFNSAFSAGGPACTIRTVESITNIRIDNYVVVDFGGFKDMVNALGGVEVCVPYDVYDPKSRLNLKAGRHNVHGQQALAYVRTRSALGNRGDLSRIDRQQAFLGSMVTKVKSTGLLLRPDRLYNFLAAATKSLTTDIGSLNDLRRLAQEVRGIDPKNVTFLTAPNQPWPPDPNRVELLPEAEQVWTALRFDQPLPGQEQKPTGTATPTGPPLVTPPERIYVEVLNGSGVTGEASRLARELTAMGYNVVSVGNADRSDYATTTVLHDPAYDESGRTLGTAIQGSEVTEDITLGTTLRIIVGADSPTVSKVTVEGSTSSPGAEGTLKTRTANSDICDTE